MRCKKLKINKIYNESQLQFLFLENNGIDNSTGAMCNLDHALEQCETTASDMSSYVGYYAMFILGQMFHGIGAVPMFTIALTYIDENCKQKMTSFYVCKYTRVYIIL